jgi:hypothetical protein
MSSVTLMPQNGSVFNSAAKNLGTSPTSDVVEIGLLLPAPWANALMELSETRKQTVGQILRSMIGHALQDAS